MNRADAKVFRFVEKTLRQYAREFGLRLRTVRVTSERDARDGTYGRCFWSGVIHVTLRWPEPDGRPVLAYSLVETMAHELAHLRHFGHCGRWVRLHAEIFKRMADDGVFDKLAKLVQRRP